MPNPKPETMEYALQRVDSWRALANRFVHDNDVDDVLQKARIKVWKYWPRFDATKGKLNTWVSNIVKQCAMTWRRDMGRNKRKNEILNTDTAVRSLSDPEVVRTILERSREQHAISERVLNIVLTNRHRSKGCRSLDKILTGTIKRRPTYTVVEAVKAGIAARIKRADDRAIGVYKQFVALGSGSVRAFAKRNGVPFSSADTLIKRGRKLHDRENTNVSS
jgi:hypothetical protein